MSESEDLKANLADLDDQLRTLRGETNGLTGQVGGEDDGAQDREDTAAALTNSEENNALIANLEARRETLLGKINS